MIPVLMLSIGLMKTLDGFEDRLKLEFEILKDEGLNVKLKKANKGQVTYYHCYVNDEYLLKGNYEDFVNILLNCVANALSDIIINYCEPKLIQKIIEEDYFYFSKKEQSRIYDLTQRILNFSEADGKDSIFFQIKRKDFVLHKLLEYLQENNVIVLDGFLDFRLKKYISQLENAVDDAVDEYLMEKEYNEFIKLLRYFVNLQESKRNLINIVIKNNKLFLLDDQNIMIEKDKAFDIIAKENPDINADDIIVSTLINIAPKKIIIHGFTGKEKCEVINALFNIFEGKIAFCDHCDICLNLKPLTTK